MPNPWLAILLMINPMVLSPKIPKIWIWDGIIGPGHGFCGGSGLVE